MCCPRSVCSQIHSWSFPCFALCHSGTDPTGSFLRLLCQLGYSMGGTDVRLRAGGKENTGCFFPALAQAAFSTAAV